MEGIQAGMRRLGRTGRRTSGQTGRQSRPHARAHARFLGTTIVKGQAQALNLDTEPTHLDARQIRHDWSRDELQAIYDRPLLDLVFSAGEVHRRFHDASQIQQCTLLSVKTGGCSEDCAYCAQSSGRHGKKSVVEATPFLAPGTILEAARKAKAMGSTRFCMGAAWRDVGGRKSNFDAILQVVSEIRGMGLEVCTTLGMLTLEQAKALKGAGLSAYNHNLDTSREFYPKVITTRTYDDRLETLEHVRQAGIRVCSGGIVGLGEDDSDRVGLLHTLSNLPEHPESVPINALVPIKGTPLEDNKPVEVTTILRMIATARISMPKSIVRLAAGRNLYSEPEQALCFLAGANAIFTGEKMLTTPAIGWSEDESMFRRWGLSGRPSFAGESEEEDMTSVYAEVGRQRTGALKASIDERRAARRQKVGTAAAAAQSL